MTRVISDSEGSQVIIEVLSKRRRPRASTSPRAAIMMTASVVTAEIVAELTRGASDSDLSAKSRPDLCMAMCCVVWFCAVQSGVSRLKHTVDCTALHHGSSSGTQCSVSIEI